MRVKANAVCKITLQKRVKAIDEIIGEMCATMDVYGAQTLSEGLKVAHIYDKSLSVWALH